MRLLLDTHILLWCLVNDPALPAPAWTLVADPANDKYVSPISLWEIAIKARTGKLPVDIDEVLAAVEKSAYIPLLFTFVHAAAVARLPDHHRDPFDRALIAQALSEPLRLLTHDRALAAYGNIVMLV